jgi:predicted nucleic acid-binding protein
MPDRPYLTWPVFRRSVVAAFGRSVTLAVRGTLGVLVQARESSVLPALKPVLDALVAEGFRIAPALVRQALEYVGEVDRAGEP